MRELKKKGYRKNSIVIIIILSLVLSLTEGFTFNDRRVGAENISNPLVGKKIVAMDHSDYTGVLTDEGDLYVWGYYARNLYGVLDPNRPNKILENIKKINLASASNLDKSLALSKDGKLYCWSSDSLEVVLNDIRDMGVLGAGESHCTYYAIDNNNTLYTFGDECYLGREVDEEYSSYSIDAVAILSNVRDIFPREYPSDFCAVTTETGDLYVWGQARDEWSRSQVTPLKIASDVKKVLMGHNDLICLLKEDGTLYTGILDENMVLDEKIVPFISGISDVFLGNRDCYALTEAGEIYIINPNVEESNQIEPVMENIEKMVFSEDIFAAISKSKDMYMWLGDFGYNYYGIMGDGTTSDSKEENPRLVLSDVEDVIISRDERVLAKKTNGDLYQWGRDSYGGMGSISNSYTPMKYLSNVDSILYCNASLMGVLTKDGNCYMWGNNYGRDIVYAEDVIVYDPYCITEENKEDTHFQLQNGYLTGLKLSNNTVDAIHKQLGEKNVVCKSATGEELSENDLLGTGSIVCITESDGTVAEYEVILVGDIYGDGKIDSKDVSYLARYRLGKESLSDAQLAAADVYEDGKVDSKDVSKLARYRLGKDTISSQ